MFYFFDEQDYLCSAQRTTQCWTYRQEKRPIAKCQMWQFTTYKQVAKFLLKKYATDEFIIIKIKVQDNASRATARYDVVPRCRKDGSQNPPVRDVFEDYSLNELFIARLDVSIGLSIHKRWGSQKHKADLDDLTFQVSSPLRLQRQNLTFKRTNPSTARPQTQRRNSLSTHKSGANATQSGFMSIPSAYTRGTTWTSAVVLDTSTQSAPSDTIYTLISSFEVQSTVDDAFYCVACLSKNYKTL